MGDKLPPLPGASRKTSNKGADITIHVCDETKNLKKDFTCSRELLLEEMKYFQDYLSRDTEKWEDVDISVHCDIKIFDWLICYVKERGNEGEPLLTANNVVSILISSEFLKMAALVEKCIGYLTENMSKVIASPCNMNCINDKLVTRIASKMNQHVVEEVTDRKDKFKSKLFSKKLEELFQPSSEENFTLNNACYLYKCTFCRKLLIPNVENDVECTVNRTTLDRFGDLKFKHMRDPNWSASDYLLSLKQQESTWRMVYWRIWSHVNFLKCSVCDIIFPLCELFQCLTHPDNDIDKSSNSTTYSCCDQRRKLFEPIRTRTGCSYKEHRIDLNYPKNSAKVEGVIGELETMKGFICLRKEIRKSVNHQNRRYDITSMINLSLNEPSFHANHIVERYNLKSTGHRKDTYYRPIVRKMTLEDDEDSDSEEPGIVRISIQTKNYPSCSRNSSRTWNSDLPLRLNQDMQRESDLKRMTSIIENLRLDVRNSESQVSKSETSCGTFFNIEQKRKKDISQSNSHVNIFVNKKGRLLWER